MALPELVAVADAAAWLGVSVKAIYAKVERGSMPGATRLGGRLYFVRADLVAWIEQGRVPLTGGKP